MTEKKDDKTKNSGDTDLWDQYINDSVGLDDEDSPPPQAEEPLDNTDNTFDDMLIPEDDGFIDQTSLKIDEIQTVVKRLQKDFQEKIKIDEQKNKVIDSLHHELQEYKDDVFKKHLHATIMDIIQFVDNMKKLINYHKKQDISKIGPQKLLRLLHSIPSDLEDICSRQGVFSFVCEGKTFDPARQRILKRVATADPQKDKTIAESLRPGYEWDSKVIRPEMVAVYHFQPPIAETEAGDKSDE